MTVSPLCVLRPDQTIKCGWKGMVDMGWCVALEHESHPGMLRSPPPKRARAGRLERGKGERKCCSGSSIA